MGGSYPEICSIYLSCITTDSSWYLLRIYTLHLYSTNHVVLPGSDITLLLVLYSLHSS